MICSDVFITVPDGYKPISEISVGEEVFNFRTNQATKIVKIEKEVLQVHLMFVFPNLPHFRCSSDQILQSDIGLIKAMDVCRKCGILTVYGYVNPLRIQPITLQLDGFSLYTNIPDRYMIANGVIIPIEYVSDFKGELND